MKKVIFKKGEKIITVPWRKFQSKSEIEGLYTKLLHEECPGNINFDEEVTEITLDKCDINQNMKFILKENQKINLVNCTNGNHHSDLFIIGGHTNIEHGNFSCVRLIIREGLSTTLNLDENSDFSDVQILSSKIHITGGNIRSYASSIYLSSNSLELQKSKIATNFLKISASQLTMEDSTIDCHDIYLDYQNLDMKDIRFRAVHGSLNLSKVISGNFLNPNSLKREKRVSYDMEQYLIDKREKRVSYGDSKYYYVIEPLTSEDILDEKNQAIVSLISILKGTSQKATDKNSQEIQLISSKIEDSTNPRIEALEKQIALLEEEKALLIENTQYNKMKVEELLQNRKIKSIGAKKR